MKKIAIFASGSGSNMQKIAEYLRENPQSGVQIACVISDQPSAYVLERAKSFGIPSHYLTREHLGTPTQLLPLLQRYGVEAIVLAGYLRLIPEFLLDAYPQRIVNIHPALLPKYGGKGMHGMHVHRAVKAAGETESGITIHIIDKEYDRGTTLFQATTDIDSIHDTAEQIQQKVMILEHRHFAPTIVQWISGLPNHHQPAIDTPNLLY